jgi:hypothetical protein
MDDTFPRQRASAFPIVHECRPLLQYVATTGRFNEEEMMWRQGGRIGDRRDGDEVQTQTRNEDGQHREGGHNEQ